MSSLLDWNHHFKPTGLEVVSTSSQQDCLPLPVETPVLGTGYQHHFKPVGLGTVTTSSQSVYVEVDGLPSVAPDIDESRQSLSDACAGHRL